MGRNSFRHTVFDSKTTVHVLLTLFLPYLQRHHDSYSGLGLMYLEGMGLEQVRMQHSVVHTFTSWLVLTCTYIAPIQMLSLVIFLMCVCYLHCLSYYHSWTSVVVCDSCVELILLEIHELEWRLQPSRTNTAYYCTSSSHKCTRGNGSLAVSYSLQKKKKKKKKTVFCASHTTNCINENISSYDKTIITIVPGKIICLLPLVLYLCCALVTIQMATIQMATIQTATIQMATKLCCLPV